MIDAKELRIGNWVSENVLGYCRVHGANTTYAYLEINNLTIDKKPEMVIYTINTSSLSPIPLTPDILGKCGFEQERESVLYFKISIGELLISCRLEYNTFYVSEGEHDIIEVGYKIQSLHQLQNLYFSLTQKELEIKL